MITQNRAGTSKLIKQSCDTQLEATAMLPPNTMPKQGLGISFAQHQQQLHSQEQRQQQQSPTRSRTPVFQTQPAFSLRPTHSRGASSLSSPARSIREQEQEQEDDEQTPLVSQRPLPTTSSDAGSSRNGRGASRAGSVASASSGSTRKLVKKMSRSEFTNRDGRAASPTPGHALGQFTRLSDDDGGRHSTDVSLYTEEVEATPRPDSSADHSISPIDFPAPPNTRPPHQSQVSPDLPTASPEDYHGPRAISQYIPHSASVPVVPQVSATSWREEQVQQKRTSANSGLSSGTHSRNAALFETERQGVMPSMPFSAASGVYRHSEALYNAPSLAVQAFPRPHPLPLAPFQYQPQPQPIITQQPVQLGRQRSLSDGASLLLRQGTLLHPQSSNKRASTELGILLGSKSSRRLSTGKLLPAPEEVALRRVELMMGDGMIGKDQRVGLEAKKKAKARIEVDVVLERDCVVEGGNVRGRLEVLVRGGKRGEGVRVGAGKIRVLGFEDLAPPGQRHIFFHQSYPLPLFQNPPVLNGPTSSLFGSEADDEGYRLAVEGSHFIPFCMRLPLHGGAKGTYTSPGDKGPCVRYVVVGSVKLHMTATNKRSIAHFYRPIHLLPYLNPAIVLAPATQPIVASVERGLGWSLGGEKGRVELTARVARSTWVSGQRVWCEVGVRNGSSRKIKSLDVALLQTVRVFAAEAESSSSGAQRGCLPKSGSTSKTTDNDAATASTVRRKLVEECLEADGTSKGAGRVTGKGWWTGVDAGGQGRWECSLQVPPGLVSIRRARHIEVSYVLRVTVNGSIYVDLPVTLINFLSIDPPPPFCMPGQAPLSASATVQIPVDLAMHKSQPETVDIHDTFKRGFEVNVDYGAYQQQRPVGMAHTRSNSDFSLRDQGGHARASSTTLDLDELLAAGQARAEAARMQDGNVPKSRPLSMSESVASNYGGARSAEGPSTSSSNLHGMAHIKRARSTPQLRPKGSRMQLDASDAESVVSGEDEANDLRALEARRRVGRQLSLAVLETSEVPHSSPTRSTEDTYELGLEELTPRETASLPAFVPAGTPHGESIKMMQDTPFVPDVPQLSPTPIPDEICEVEEPTSEDERESVLDDIMTDEYERVLDQSYEQVDETFGSEYDYQPDHPDGLFPPTVEASQRGSGLVHDAQLDLGLHPERSTIQHTAQSRSLIGSFAASAVSAASGEESEMGMLQQAVRRNLSVKVSNPLAPSETCERSPQPAADSVLSTPRKPSFTDMTRQSSQDSPRKFPSLASPIGMRRELSNGLSSLRDHSNDVKQPPSTSPSQASYMASSPISKRHLAYSPGPSSMNKGRALMLEQETPQWTAQDTQRVEEGEVPELAQSVAGDSASSEGEGLESPQLDILTPLVSPRTGSVMSPGRRALPRVPSMRSNGSPQSSYGGSNRASWSPSAALIRSQSIFGNAAKVPLSYPPPNGPRAPRPVSNAFDDHGVPLSPALSTASSANSVLPSVRSKIAHLESRDEALRHFTNVALAQSASAPQQRRSYTAALGRLNRHSTYDDDEQESGYSPRRQSTAVYQQGEHSRDAVDDDDDVPLAHLRKGSVTSFRSNSTTATTIEDAFLSRNISLASQKTYHALSPQQIFPRLPLTLGGISDEESSDGLL